MTESSPNSPPPAGQLDLLRAAFQERLGPDRFRLWIDPNKLRIEGTAVAVGADSRFKADCMRRQLGRELRRAAQTVLGESVSLEFLVDESAAVAGAPATLAPAQAAATGQTAVVPQKLPIRPGVGRRWATLDEFVAAASNQVALTSVQMAISEPGRIVPIYLHGPSGVGKTHLLESVRSALGRNRKLGPVVYLTSEQFTSEYVAGVRGGLPSFRARFRNVGVLLIDDVQFLRGKPGTVGELVQTIDTLSREGRQVVLAGEHAPAELHDLGPDFQSRLLGGVDCRIASPEYETRLAILRGMAQRQQMDLAEPVLEAMAERVTGGGRLLAGALHRYQLLQRSGQGAPSVEAVCGAILDLAAPPRPAPKLCDIEHAVCEVFGIRAEMLHANRRTRNVVVPRTVVMFLARNRTQAAFSEIARFYNHNSHTTVIAAQRRIDAMRSANQVIETARGTLTIQQVLREAERLLDATA